MGVGIGLDPVIPHERKGIRPPDLHRGAPPLRGVEVVKTQRETR